MAKAFVFVIAACTFGLMSMPEAPAACLGGHGGKASQPAGDCQGAQSPMPQPVSGQLLTAEDGAALAGIHQVGFENVSTAHRYVCTPSGFGQMATCN